MAIRNIRTIGDDVLRKKCKEVVEITNRELTLIEDMVDTMFEANGVGLAAPQVGVLKRIFVIDIGDENGTMVFINPEILETKGTQCDEEGCLSIPGESNPVERPNYVKVKAFNEKGEELAISFNHHRNIRSTMINHPACFVTKALYEKYGCYNTKYRSAADFDFMLKMFEQKEVVFVPDHQIYTNFTYGGMSGSYTGVQEDNEVRYRNGIITRKKYILTKMKNSLKHYLGV